MMKRRLVAKEIVATPLLDKAREDVRAAEELETWIARRIESEV